MKNSEKINSEAIILIRKIQKFPEMTEIIRD